MRFVGHLSWILRALVFLAILLLAVMNTDPVKLRFFLGMTWETPMILAILVFLALGAALGVLACLPRLLRQRSEIARLKRELNPGRTGSHRSPGDA
jgi:putative membrane protein